MAPPDGSGSRRLPTLSWNSIVDDVDPPPASPPIPDAPAPDVADPPNEPVARLGDDAPDIVPVAPLSLGDLPSVAPPEPAPPAPPAPPPAVDPPPADPPLAEPLAAAETTASVVEQAAVAEPAAVVEQPVVHDVPEPPVEVRSTPPQPVVAPIGPVAEPAPAVVSSELPQIREATPVPALDPSPDVDPTGVVPTVDGPDEGARTVPEYRLPSIPEPDTVRVAPPPEIDTYVVPSSTNARTTRRRSSGGGLKLLLALVVLGGLVAAGVIVGRPYLFPEGWDAAAEPYADAVGSVTGAEYTDRFLLVAEPTAGYTTRMSGTLTGDWTAEAPQWRALGLVSGEANAENVTLLLEGWQHAVHDPSDGQVYRDAGLEGPQLDAEITRAFASVLLDQQYAWSGQQTARTLDDAAWTLAEVQRQAARTQASSPYAAPVEPRATAALSFLPPVLAYEVLAPATFAAFDRPDLPDASSGADNPLRGLGVNGPGPLAPDLPVAASAPDVLEGDTISGAPVAVDRSFWYLVLAGYLDTRTAYQASEAIVESSMTLAERVANRCVYATFSGGDVEQTATLRTALETWAATVPLEMSASFTVLADGTLQLTTCDPGSRFENGSRLGVGRELIGWRMAETATTLAVVADGGTAADVAAAWAVVEASNVPVDLANLPFDTVPADAAAAAVAAVAGLLTPAGG